MAKGKAATCDGTWPDKQPCTVGKHGAVQLRGKCKRCHEKRCRSHCRCARQGTLIGRQCARPSAVAKAKPKAAPAPRVVRANQALAAAAPLVGRPAAPRTDLLKKEEWWRRMLEEVNAATSVVVASLSFDHTGLYECFLRRLQGRQPFTLRMLVDEESFNSKDTKQQHPRLRECAAFSQRTRVYLCRGEPGSRLGRFHAKALVVDGRSMFCGSSNYTNKSLQNFEFPLLRVAGPLVAEALQELSEAQGRGRQWHG
jgi:hypothetical protein